MYFLKQFFGSLILKLMLQDIELLKFSKKWRNKNVAGEFSQVSLSGRG